ncbi:tRNA (adenosine(37)-N6)-threonylcarbamoyltransferase complex dimerization subunit type 1 TsaB [Tsuneonella sp. YG55]|uniref:tRNA (Adenosine(37)-N6)-threonylcarbamoyltransferase complex dimerization subunit type 1 TsaB n=2 Tax=Tsuneonella litorea TaxID=2976475 RepID=A0A9X3AME3_9SPHN|nr:tRNA (adenosine(37)-N6)-threonylcarbamoyltransferase complex dimerization subunit type 1 TsaB [Tsuneonella litorea]
MRTLAIECATEACSVALFEGDDLLAGDHRVLGRGHAEHLVPMIAALPDKGRAARILVSRGPGSFTGVRIGLAVAGSLAVAWKAPVRGYPTLSLVGAMALEEMDGADITVCMAGGHGEWFVQDFAAGGVPLTPLASLDPAAAAVRGASRQIAGSRASDLAALLEGDHRALSLLPDARRVNALAEGVTGGDTSPLYGRGPDARLPA